MEENNIVLDAYFLINLFHRDKKEITQLHVQKLMFIFEAYYMNIYDNIKELYPCQYKAWAFGPVATQLYNRFKKYGKDDIELTEEEIEKANSISEEKKILLTNIYEKFKDFSATQLVNFTHADGSPWKEAWENEQYSNISKEKMKKWFSKYVSKE